MLDQDWTVPGRKPSPWLERTEPAGFVHMHTTSFREAQVGCSRDCIRKDGHGGSHASSFGSARRLTAYP